MDQVPEALYKTPLARGDAGCRGRGPKSTTKASERARQKQSLLLCGRERQGEGGGGM